MFGDIFENAEDMEWSAQIGTTLTYEQRKPKNCAHFLDLPPMRRDKYPFCGLKNQGATCYLNSLIQLCYMSPEFRNAILRLPLCKDTIEEPSGFAPGKFKILFALQKLLSEMQDLDVRALTTEKVTDSFGWNDNQAMIQQDIQEANRVIFDVIDRALFGTEYSDSIAKNYKGTIVNVLECLGCGLVKEREESFYDLIMQVKGLSSIEESLLNMITLEKLEGSNQYFCEQCNKKVDAYKGIKIRRFPPILTFSLSRFEYDYMKGEMKKINDSFEFGLELDISIFAEKPEAYENEDDKIYELAGVLIHRGDPYGGHYHTYIRDQLSEADWEQRLNEIKAEKDQRKKEKEKEAKEAAEKTEGEAANKKEAEVNEEKPQQEEGQEEKKKGKKDKGNKRKRKNSGEVKEEKEKKKEEKEEKRRELYDDTVLDDVDFPIEFSNKKLAYNWWDFNDSQVNPIPVNRLQTQFGGKSNENAYILLYRQRSLAKDANFKKPELLPYLKKNIQAQNEAIENEIKVYREAETQLEMIFLDSALINIYDRKFFDPIDPIKVGQKLRLGFESTIGDVYQQLKLENPENYVLVELQTLPNNLIQFKRVVDSSLSDQKISELNIECWSLWIPFSLDDKLLLEEIIPYCGADFVPIRVNLRNPQSKDTPIITFMNIKLKDFRVQVEKNLNIPYDHQLLLLMEGEVPKVINNKPEDNEEEIKKLGIIDNTDVLVNEIDPEELKRQREELERAKEKENPQQDKNEEQPIGNMTENLVSVLVERDDEDGVVKYYVDLDWTLVELIQNIKKKLNIPEDSERRLRKLNGNALFYEEDLPLKLKDLEFAEGGKRLRLERGKTPQFGNLSIRIRNQSKLKKEKDVENLDIIGFPSETLQDLKKRACELLGLEANDHKLYQTDWLEEPVQVFAKEDRNLREAGIKQGELLVLRDKDSPIAKEVLKLNFYVTKTGISDDWEYIGIIQAKEEQTLQELKNAIFEMPQFSERKIDSECLRIREMRKDLSFGKIYRGNNKTLKKFAFETNMNIVAQVMDKSENLSENSIVLLLRKRQVDSQTYSRAEEFIWEAGKEPTIEDLKKAVLAFKGLEAGIEGVELAKYIPHEFQWLHVSKEVIERERDSKKAKKGGNKGNKNKKAAKDVPEKEAVNQQAENLRKAPYVLHDGDVIGYRLEVENVEKKDDFQTQEDEERRKNFLAEKAKADAEKVSGSRKNRNQGGFQIYTDF